MSSSELGPLPEADLQSQLERRSIAAFQACLPTDRFVFRDERVTDAGVDGSLEVLIASRYTNMRSQVQLKSTAVPTRNQDGSVSISVSTGNLNYLLNGPSPLYVLYIAGENELRFAWARDERQRIENANAEWQSQQTVSLRFSKVIDGEALDEIYREIQQEGRFARTINDVLAMASLGETVSVTISEDSLSAVTTGEIFRMVTEQGMSIVAAGFGTRIVDLIGSLHVDQQAHARVQLVKAYGSYSISRYHQCLAAIAEATRSKNCLSLHDSQFLHSLQNACQFHLGSITREEFDRREQALFEPGSVFQLQHELDRLRMATLLQRDDQQQQIHLDELRTVVDRISQHKDSTDAIALHAAIVRLYVEGFVASMAQTTNFMFRQMRYGMGILGETSELDGRDTRVRKALSEWLVQANQIVERANAIGHPILLGDAVSTRVTVALSFHSMADLEAIASGSEYHLPQDAQQALASEIEFATEVYSASNNVEGELRCKMLLADLHDLAGNHNAAVGIAQEVLPIAEAFGLATAAESANSHIGGRSLRQQFRDRSAAVRGLDQDVILATESNEHIRAYALACLRALSLPDDRLKNVETDCRYSRDVARERVNWCRHISVEQDLRHTFHAETHYAIDPNRVCVCMLHKFRSRIENPDANTIVAAFKAAYCDNCRERSPKRDT